MRRGFGWESETVCERGVEMGWCGGRGGVVSVKYNCAREKKNVSSSLHT